MGWDWTLILGSINNWAGVGLRGRGLKLGPAWPDWINGRIGSELPQPGPGPVRSNLKLGQAWICFGLAWPMNSPSNHHVHGFRFIWLWITTNGSQTEVGVVQAVDFGGPQEYSYWTIRRLQIELLVQSELFLSRWSMFLEPSVASGYETVLVVPVGSWLEYLSKP